MPQRLLFIAAITCFFQAAAAEPAKPAEPPPNFGDVSFGPHPHQLIDIYLPKKGNAPSVLLSAACWRMRACSVIARCRVPTFIGMG